MLKVGDLPFGIARCSWARRLWTEIVEAWMGLWRRVWVAWKGVCFPFWVAGSGLVVVVVVGGSGIIYREGRGDASEANRDVAAMRGVWESFYIWQPFLFLP